MITLILAVLLSQSVGPGANVSVPLLSSPRSSAEPSGPWERSPEAVDGLPAYQLESGVVTRKELQLAERWTGAVTSVGREKFDWLDRWLGAGLPFSFRYGGKESAPLLAKWELERRERKHDSHGQQQELVWTDAATGLRLRWQVTRFADYPAVEWLLWFENNGEQDTPLLEDIQDLDLRLSHSRKGEPYVVHGAHGGRYMRDDWWPFSKEVPATIVGMPDFVDGRGLQLGGAYPSSRRELPFFNLETPEARGVIVGVGWTGDWLGRVKSRETELTVRVGLNETHFVLHPGEQVRTARSKNRHIL